jgi:hypothetical protein
VEARGFVLRRNWLPLVVGIASAVFGIALMYSGAILGLFPAMFGIVFGPLIAIRNGFPHRIPTTVLASKESVLIQGWADVPIDEIIEMKIQPRWAHDCVVDIATKERAYTLRLHVNDAHALGALVGTRRSRFRLIVPFWQRYVGFIVALVVLSAFRAGVELVPFSLPGILLVSWPLAWLVGLVRGTLVVGADGFTRRWLWWRRFTAFSDVAGVRSGPKVDTIVDLASKKKIRLRAVDAPNTDEERGAEPRAMYTHIGEAYVASTRVMRVNDIRALVDRGARDAREWLASLDGLAHGQGLGYRAAVVTPEMLEELAVDPTAEATVRVGAAAALVRIGDEQNRTRVRVSAEACAEPEVREALLAVADARTDEAAVFALSALEAKR